MHRCAGLRLLHQHHGFPADVRSIESTGLLIGKREEQLATAILLFGRHHMVYLQRLRAGTLGVAEHMQLGNIKSLQELVGSVEVFFRLATGTHDDIHPDKGMRHHFLDLPYLVSEQGSVVPTAHELQHLVASALQRDVEVRHERTGAGHIVDDFIGKQVRFDGRDAITLNALYGIQRLDQIEERLAGGLPEIADVHTGNDNLLASFGHSLTGLCHQILYPPVTATATGKRNGAIGTEVVATILHLEEIAGTVSTRARRGKAADVLERTGHRLPLGVLLQVAQVIHQAAFLLGTEYHIHPFDGSYLLGLELGIATRHHHKGSRMVLHQAMDGLTAFLVRHFGDRTSVHHANVRLLPFPSRTYSRFLQNLSDSGGLREVQFTAQGVINGLLILKYSSIYHSSSHLMRKDINKKRNNTPVNTNCHSERNVV